MRRFVLCSLLALVLPATANAAVRVAAFYYPWYGTSARVGAAAAGGFDGVYTYDIVVYGAAKFARICAEARAVKLVCAPSVGPGYDARRGSGDPVVKLRRNGATYDSMWRMAIAAQAER